MTEMVFHLRARMSQYVLILDKMGGNAMKVEGVIDEVVARQDIGDGLELVTRRVHNKWEPKVYEDLMSHKGEPTFFSRLCNYVAQMVFDRQYGEGAFAKLDDDSQYQLYIEASWHVEAIRDLGHLMN